MYSLIFRSDYDGSTPAQSLERPSMDNMAILEKARRPVREYQKVFANLPEGLLKLAATWGSSGLLLAALTAAVRTGQAITDWSPFVPTLPEGSGATLLAEPPD
jgi:hypothetical protein